MKQFVIAKASDLGTMVECYGPFETGSAANQALDELDDTSDGAVSRARQGGDAFFHIVEIESMNALQEQYLED